MLKDQNCSNPYHGWDWTEIGMNQNKKIYRKNSSICVDVVYQFQWKVVHDSASNKKQDISQENH
jgi:hypothetical protein